MKRTPNTSIIRGLLFTYDIENTDDLEREKLIASKNVNNERELIELFDELTKPEFLSYTKSDQGWFINLIEHYLSTDDNFDFVFKRMTTYFSSDVTDQRDFMQTFLKCLKKYSNAHDPEI